ncbi:MAG: ester cyclase [Pseudomonadota bacterium]
MKTRQIISFFALSLSLLSVQARAGEIASPKQALVQALFSEAYNKHELGHLDRYFDPAFVHRDARGDLGLAAVAANFAPVFAAFSDWHAQIEQTMVDGDRVLVFVSWSGTHDGTLRGYPATGKKVQVRTADMYRIADGKIVEHWDVASPLDLMQQIGLLDFKFGK